ncbi:probable helicase senataxin [Rhineura floridana]|uniref:probable helicase senataxin n=1 Tax=Rhineura floridana TaxID=261503 RepID=UPI002AC88C74|nr:probable helicase senataxin [Rhineura floridana]XP_061460180.1 probable helicase senataxin [Rhineura floridana]XP_061460182.1 probable helicase senataxin [Rhineura floridana]XP_061460183.1 probable helicase senataxin [Rhineura floridana]XP_061460184.1 probable helicase senataxin [Rhineura floridana]XP_061460185.1 probable helicase senataxin [Rhineura floridana]XP_061460186.1 probable helicase senataxin [Rhineura floridana]
MSTCCWCTPGGSVAILLKSYASRMLPEKESDAASDDLCCCLECVDVYHKARDELPLFHEILWEVETTRLIKHFEKRMKEADDLYIVEEDSETPLSCYTGPDFEKHLRVPLLEVLKYPYLLLHERLSELCIEALCKMEQTNYSYQVVDKHPGIYLLMVHPNEVIRRWAIQAARSLGKVDRDDYYDIQEVLTCLFKVIELGLIENPEIYNSSVVEKGKLILLPSHLYDSTNYKNYWLGICMLLMVLEEQAMDSLLLGPDKQNDFMQSIMNTMKSKKDDESNNPFWPALHCFMVILDKLGSKVWGQLIDPIEAFQTIINNESYKKELESVRQSCRRTKSEPLSDYGDETITCSQLVYNYHIEKPHKGAGRRSAICPDYCPNLYEDMQTLTDMFQFDIGRDMRLHNSTFLWFIPFVHSLMDLKDLGVFYSLEVIRHLCSEIKEVLNDSVQFCDKVSEFFIWILVTVLELHLKKNCLRSLWVSSEKWVGAVVNCAKLPSAVFAHGAERGKARNYLKSTAAASSREHESIQSACMRLIRNILKEGCQVGQALVCKPYLDKLNLHRRSHTHWELSPQEAQELKASLKQIVRSMWSKSFNPSSHVESPAAVCITPPPLSIKQERQEDRCPVNTHDEHPPYLSLAGKDEAYQEGPSSRRSCGLGEERWEDSSKDPSLQRTSGCYLTSIKQELKESSVQEGSNLSFLLANRHMDAQKKASCCQVLGDQKKWDSTNKSCPDPGFQNRETNYVSEKEERPTESRFLADKSIDDRKGSHTSKITSQKPDLTLKLKQLVENRRRRSILLEMGADKQQSVKDRSKSQEGQKSEIIASRNTPVVSLCKSEASSSDAFVSKLLFTEKESKDRLAEFRKGEQDSEGSSTDDEMANVPFEKIRQELVKKKAAEVAAAAAASPETDSQIDRDLSKLSMAAYAKGTSFPVDSSQEDGMHFQNRIKRKVKGTARSWSANEGNEWSSDTDSLSNQVIIISDTSSDEDENKVNGGERRKGEVVACLEKRSSAQGQEPLTISNPTLLYEECESQLFEFETEEEIHSEWQDSQMEEKAMQRRGLSTKTSNCPTAHDLELVKQINDWGYDTDYLGNDITEKAAEDLEHQVKDSKTKAKPDALARKEWVGEGNPMVCSDVTEARAYGGERATRIDPVLPCVPASARHSGSTSVVKESTARPRNCSAKSQQIKTAKESPKKGSVKPYEHNKKSLQAKPARSTPAVVPPNKVHRFPAPTSVTEQLSLKKKVRRAAELSQRTQDSIAKLRSYGKIAGEVDVPQQRRKSQLIKAQRLNMRNKKMLACQERQFYRQMRPKEREKDRCAHGGDPEAQSATGGKAGPKPASMVVIENEEERSDRLSNSSGNERQLLRQSSLERGEVQSTPVSPVKEFPSTRQELANADRSIQERTTNVPTSVGSLCSSVARSSKSHPVILPSPSSVSCNEEVALKESEPQLSANVKAGDDLFLTQMDPVDMELCSQIENGSHPTGMEINTPESTEICKHTGCTEKVNKAGEYCRNHSDCDPPDHVFAKPFAAPRLSTTKIFSSSNSSRSANLTKDLENVLKPLAPLKSKSYPLKPPDPKVGGLKLKTPTLSSIFRPQNSNNTPQLQNVPNNHIVHNGRVPTAPRAASRHEAWPPFAQANGANAQQRDHKIFVKEVLRWSYDMFANFSLLGPPNHLSQSIVAPAPTRFRDYDDYFNTFFPLMMLNAFETVAQEWLENHKSKEQKPCCLTLLNFSADQSKAYFTAKVSESDLDKQQHPKEDDLVFLIVSGKRSLYDEEGEAECRPVRHVGLVDRFIPPPVRDMKKKEEQAVCHLYVQTQGNLSRINKSVKCVVVSSLVTMKRMFKALLLLNRSPLVNSIISSSYSDFSPASLNTDAENSISHISYMREFNEDQRRAIEIAYALVTQQPSFPKVCLIYGPPGTGKSKTILGLLYCILNERSGQENPVQSINAKNKRNRVLVCAPSNAAVDDLMKKLILMFKEKCQDRDKPLGNCGDINLVRLGQEKSISKDVRKFSLNVQVDHRMKRATLGKDQDIHKRKEELDRQLDALSRQRALHRSQSGQKALRSVVNWTEKQQLDEETCRLAQERQRLAVQLKEVRKRSQELKASIILESHVICCTLSTSGSTLLETAFRRLGRDPLSCVIVDEAVQSCEVETIIPLIYGCKKLVLVGDPKQLPPTVKSVKAEENGYGQSLMGRLCKDLDRQIQEKLIDRLPIQRLRTQYRMHPEICLFPSNYIYDHALKTDRWTEKNRFSLDWPFQPYLLFDVLDAQEERESDSFVNLQEVKLVMELMKLIRSRRRDIGFRNIGIITPYSAQKRKVLSQLEKEFGENSVGEVDTVDGFQGREKDCIIVTCVRANTTQGSIGFLKSLQRLNVTITRARYSLFILGHLQTLMENEDWNALIQDAQKRGAIIQTSNAKYAGVSSYSSSAKNILKNILKPMPVQQRLERAAQGQANAATAATERNDAPGRHPRQALAGAGAPAQGNGRVRPLTVCQDSSSSSSASPKPPLPSQAKSVQERPKDPRLARRPESSTKGTPCQLGSLSATSGPGRVLPQSPKSTTAQRHWSNATQQPASKMETFSIPVLNFQAQGSPAQGRLLSAQDRDWRVPVSRGRGEHPQGPTEWSKGKDSRSSCRRASKELRESRNPEAKRRRTME